MAEYIEREALIDWLTKPTGFKTNCEDCTSIDCLDCIVDEAIKNAPAADVAPVVHGRWIHDINNLYGCSECMERETMSPKKLKPYCPNCGARMDGE